MSLPKDDSFSSVTSDIALPIFKNLIEGNGNIFIQLRKRLKDKELERKIWTACQNYQRNYEEDNCRIKVLGMGKPAQLELIYTEANFLENNTDYSLEEYSSAEELSEKKDKQKRGFANKNKSIKLGIEIVNQNSKLMVLGEAGAGKSTFLRMIGWEALKRENRKYQHYCIPVFIELKRFGSEGIDDIVKIIANGFGNCGFPEPEDFTNEALKKGKLLLLLDGLDEVPERILNKLILKIKDFANKYRSNRFIASCRTAARYSSLLEFTDFVMASFNDDQIDKYINRWFQQEEDRKAGTAQRCLELLQSPDHAAARELAQNPLLLTLLCLVYESSQNFPYNRASLYDEALNVFLKDWLVQKRVERDSIYKDFSTGLETTMLAEIAYDGFYQERIYFDKQDLVKKIQTFFNDNLNTPQNLKNMDGEKVLRAIEVQQGILVERAKNVYTFSHLTFQEYLTAHYINSHNQIEKLVTAHFSDTRWQEVFLLVTGLMNSGADDFLLLLEKQIQKLTNTPKLREVLQWANSFTNEWKGDFNPVSMRAMALDVVGALVEARINGSPQSNRTANFRNDANAFSSAGTLACILDERIAPALKRIHSIVSAAASLSALANYRERTRNLKQMRRKLKIFNQVDFDILNNNLEIWISRVQHNNQRDVVRPEFAQEIWKTWVKAFKLEPEQVLLTTTERENLHHYLYANLLMVKCKKSALRVSPDTWRKIESRMLGVRAGK